VTEIRRAPVAKGAQKARVMKKIRPIDIPEDLIEQLADRLQVDTGMTADLLAHLCT
jgi:hypothetical protein